MKFKYSTKIFFSIFIFIVLMSIFYWRYCVSNQLTYNILSFKYFMYGWGGLIGIVATIFIGFFIAIIPSSIDRKIESISESLQFPLNNFSQIFTQSLEILKWIGDEKGSDFFITSATPIFGIELAENERMEWTKLLEKRIKAGENGELTTTMHCLDWKPTESFFNSPLYLFSKGLEDHKVLETSDLKTGIELFKRSIYSYLEFMQFSAYEGFKIKIGEKPQAQIILATKSSGETKGIIYFTTIRSNRLHVVSGLRSSDNKWISIMKNIAGFLDEKSRDAFLDFSETEWNKDQIDRCLSLFEYQIKHIEIYDVDKFPEHKIKVFPGVFPPEFGLGNEILVKSIIGVSKQLKSSRGGKFVGIDVGTGSGLLALYLADYCEKVFATDIFKTAVENARYNCKHNESIKVFEGNLVEPVKEYLNSEFPIFVFNFPYYPSPLSVFNPKGGSKTGKDIIKEFFTSIIDVLKEDGIVIMPFSSIASADHNPCVIAPDFDLKSVKFSEDSDCKVYLFSYKDYSIQTVNDI